MTPESSSLDICEFYSESDFEGINILGSKIMVKTCDGGVT